MFITVYIFSFRKLRYGDLTTEKEINMLKYMYIYVLADVCNQKLYTGVALDLPEATIKHKQILTNNIKKKPLINLVYFEQHYAPYTTYQRHLDICALGTEKKLQLINAVNPEWKDLLHRNRASSHHTAA